MVYAGLLSSALIVSGSAVYLILVDQLTNAFDVTLLSNAEHAGGAFAQDIDQDGTLRPADRLIHQFASTGGRVVIIDPDGQIIGDSAPTGTPALPIEPADIGAADLHRHKIRELKQDGDIVRLAVEPIISDGRTIGYVAWADSTRLLRDLLTAVAAALLLGGAAVIALAVVGGLILARRALRPVSDVTETARGIALSGDFAARVEVGAARDEVGELAVAFNEMLSALDQNHGALQRFLGDVSHQLRTPLTSIRANLELAQRQDVPADERRAILADARDEAERMARLISDLLSLARAESGARLDLAPLELDALLVESVRRERQAAHHVRMSVGRVEPAMIDGDRDRLRDLFGILLDNAARYTEAGGTVTASLSAGDGQAVVRVADTGIGLGDVDPERLFERLYRGARARQVRPAGTGLGLAIAHWIVESHAGTITLSSDEGPGTVATVTLPLLGDSRPKRMVRLPTKGAQ